MPHSTTVRVHRHTGTPPPIQTGSPGEGVLGPLPGAVVVIGMHFHVLVRPHHDPPKAQLMPVHARGLGDGNPI